MSLAIDHLEQVSVDRFAEKEPLERRGTQRLDDLTAGVDDAPAQGGEVVDRMEERDVPPELGLEHRHREPLDVEDVQLLPVADVEPARVDRRVGGDRFPAIAERRLDETRRLLDVLCRERQVREHAIARSTRRPGRATWTSRKSSACRPCW